MDQYFFSIWRLQFEKFIYIIQSNINCDIKKQILRKKNCSHIISLFIYCNLGGCSDKEFFIDLELDLNTKTAVLFHITIPRIMRNRGIGSAIVLELEKFLVSLGINYLSLPAEHHSTGFWLKMGYKFKYPKEKEFYESHDRHYYPSIAFELEKTLLNQS